MKPIKVLYNGKRLRDIYPHATRWQVFKYKVRKATRKLIIITALVGTGLAIGLTTPKTSYRVDIQERKVYIDNLSEKITALQNEALTAIQKCESAGHSEEDGLIVFDSNAKASIGQFQFQVTTVQHYMKLYNNKDITRKEAILIALDTPTARALAKQIIFDNVPHTNKPDTKGWRNWYNCGKKIEQQFIIINALTTNN